ncbi:hypothetical protein HYW82_00320 [Candidatus Peregrinibacteria bacterium]|nr:hypothetical protein [Candidatus Peregrinibacteria bacterium]
MTDFEVVSGFDNLYEKSKLNYSSDEYEDVKRAIKEGLLRLHASPVASGPPRDVSNLQGSVDALIASQTLDEEIATDM